MNQKIRIACVGDSITYGYGTNNIENESYPARLQELLGDNFIVNNYGVNAMTVLSNTETPYTQTVQYLQSLESNADIVILMLGTNDAKLGNWAKNETNFILDYEKLINKYKGMESNPYIFIATSPTAWRDYGILDDNTIIPEIVDEKVVVIQREMAKKFECGLIDIHNYTNDMKYFFPDTIHPDIEGYQRIATFVYEGIKDYCENLLANKK